MAKFAFEMNEVVALAQSSERGKVIGRAEFKDSSHQYLIRYCAGDARQTEAWWHESALER